MFVDGKEVDMVQWVKSFWNPILRYSPKASMLLNNWFSIHFMKEEDISKIIQRTWVRDKSFMHLVPWYLGFNLIMEALKRKVIWVKLSGLPLEFWTLKALRAIGESIDCTKYIYHRIIGTTEKRIAWLLVEVNFKGGLLGDVDLVWGQRRHRERVDY